MMMEPIGVLSFIFPTIVSRVLDLMIASKDTEKTITDIYQETKMDYKSAFTAVHFLTACRLLIQTREAGKKIYYQLNSKSKAVKSLQDFVSYMAKQDLIEIPNGIPVGSNSF